MDEHWQVPRFVLIFGRLLVVGIEGTSSYGTGLTRAVRPGRGP